MYNTLTFATVYEGFAVVVIILVFIIGTFGLLLVLLSPLLIIAGMARRTAHRLAAQRAGTVTTQFESPRGLSPAEVGLLYDLKCDQKEIMATLFDLEQRKIIRIDAKKQVTVIDQQAYAELHAYEQTAIHMANGQPDDEKATKSVPKKYKYGDSTQPEDFMLYVPTGNNLTTFTNQVREVLHTKGISMGNYAVIFAVRAFAVSIVLGLWPMLTAAFRTDINGYRYDAWSLEVVGDALGLTLVMAMFFWPLHFLGGLIVVKLWTTIAGRYWLSSKSVRKIWPELEGYKIFLKTVDLDNIQFESNEKHQDPATKTLPYALVFGLETKWKTRLKNRIVA